jgi:hypothetical protein
MAVVPIASDADFAAGWWLDWGQDPEAGRGLPARKCPVGDVLTLRGMPLLPGQLPAALDYPLQQTTVQVSGAGVELRFCGPGLEAALLENDGVLVAACSPGPPSAGSAPIRLRFSKPVQALGCFVAGLSLGQPAGTPYTARLWVRQSRSGSFNSAISVAGVTGVRGRFPAVRTAPFLGARGDRGIVEARFDITPDAPGGVDQVAICSLLALS